MLSKVMQNITQCHPKIYQKSQIISSNIIQNVLENFIQLCPKKVLHLGLSSRILGTAMVLDLYNIFKNLDLVLGPKPNSFSAHQT